MNPMVRKELNQRMRERRGWILPSLYLLVLAALAALAYHLVVLEGRQMQFQGREVQGSEIGIAMFLSSAYAQMAVLLLLAPIFSAGSLTIEKEQRTMAGLLTSLLSPFQIWWGKFAASLLFVLLLIVTGLPVLSVSFAFGGIGPWEIFMATLTTVVTLGSLSAVGLYWSSVFRRSVHATAVTYGTIITLTVVTFVIFLIEVSTRSRPELGTVSLDGEASSLSEPCILSHHGVRARTATLSRVGLLPGHLRVPGTPGRGADALEPAPQRRGGLRQAGVGSCSCVARP
jgi:ABC-2 type transport system permease protein